MVTATKRKFRMHDRLLFDVIQRQAGTVEKSILEGVMNSIDAGATRCEITLEEDRLVIDDDGRGFRSRSEIEKYFDVFGQPHDEDEQKTYGTFRMGRGQLFAFGPNQWRSGYYQMDVDIKLQGLDYDLTKLEEKRVGCRVEVTFYSPLQGYKLANTLSQLRKWVKFSPIPVIINGEDDTHRVADIGWEFDNEDFCLNTDSLSMLSIYNQGIFVQVVPASTYGVGGELTTRLPIKINFARNDIQDDCEVWKRVQKTLAAIFTRRVNSKKSLTIGESEALAKDLARGRAVWSEDLFNRSKLFILVNGQAVSAKRLAKLLRDRRGRLAVARKGETGPECLHESSVCCVLAKETLERFGFRTPEELSTWLRKSVERTSGCYFPETNSVNMQQLLEQYAADFRIVPPEEIGTREQNWLELLSFGRNRACWAMNKSPGRRHSWGANQELRVGTHPTAPAWTDGESYVAFNRRLLKETPFSLQGVLQMGIHLYHCLTHTGPDTTENIHDESFLQAFESRALRFLPLFIAGAQVKLRAWEADQTRRTKAGKESRRKEAIAEFKASQSKLDFADENEPDPIQEN